MIAVSRRRLSSITNGNGNYNKLIINLMINFDCANLLWFLIIYSINKKSSISIDSEISWSCLLFKLDDKVCRTTKNPSIREVSCISC